MALPVHCTVKWCHRIYMLYYQDQCSLNYGINVWAPVHRFIDLKSKRFMFNCSF